MDPITLALIFAILVTSGDAASRGRGHVYGWAGAKGAAAHLAHDATVRTLAYRKARRAKLRKTTLGRLWLALIAVSRWAVRTPFVAGRGFVRGVRDARAAGLYAARRKAAAERRARIAAKVRGRTAEDSPAPQDPQPPATPQPAPAVPADPQPAPQDPPQPAGDPVGLRGPQDPQPKEEEQMPQFEATSVPAWLGEWEELKARAEALLESGSADLQFNGAILAPGSDVVDTLSAAVESLRRDLTPIIEAANATPQGAEATALGKFREE
jgi:hypothetical protein